MSIRNDNDLEAVAERVSDGLAEIQSYLGAADNPHAKIKFPRGYIRTAFSAREQLWYIRDETIKRNLGYAHQQADVLRWIINRTDISGVAKEMIIKEVICLAAAIVETLTKQITSQEALCGKKKSFAQRCDVLKDAGAIKEATSDDLKWLWDKRQNEHIFLATDWEIGQYKMSDCNRAIRSLRAIKKELDEWYTADIPF